MTRVHSGALVLLDRLPVHTIRISHLLSEYAFVRLFQLQVSHRIRLIGLSPHSLVQYAGKESLVSYWDQVVELAECLS